MRLTHSSLMPDETKPLPGPLLIHQQKNPYNITAMQNIITEDKIIKDTFGLQEEHNFIGKVQDISCKKYIRKIVSEIKALSPRERWVPCQYFLFVKPGSVNESDIIL